MQDLKVTILQTNIFWEDKRRNLDHVEQLIRENDRNPDICILPEMFDTGFSMEPVGLAEEMDRSLTISRMKSWSREKQTIICGSTIIKEDGNYYNRFLWVSGEEVFHYDKRHLFTLAGENKQYKAGANRNIFETNDWKCFPQICYDLRFPAWSRNNLNYDVIIYVANWPTPRRNAWTNLLIARAIENQSYVIGVNRVGTDSNGHAYDGGSFVVDPKGEVLMDLGKEENVKTCKLSKENMHTFRSKYPFLDDRDEIKYTL